MIRLDNVSVTYEAGTRPSLSRVTVEVPEGELVLVAGRTGSGKSTLLGTLNNLVPRFTGGVRTGRVEIDGVDTTQAAPRELAGLVGYVGQDPAAGFVTDTVEAELAFTMEQLGVAPATMRARVEETLDLLGIAGLRHRALRTLSGGQQQRVAIGSVLTAQPRVLVLDEPTSALDPVAAEEVVALLSRLVHDLGITVVAAEHRMERVVEHADAVLLVRDGHVTYGEPRAMLAVSPVAPPLVELGRVSGWQPLPLTVRDGRRAAREERPSLAGVTLPADADGSAPGLVATGVVVRYGPVVAVAGVDLRAPAGQVTALMGRNGSGKSSLLWALHGAGPRHAGTVVVPDDGQTRGVTASAHGGDGHRSRTPSPSIALVPQTASDLLFWGSVAEELVAADTAAGAEPGATAAILERLAPGIDPAQHPRDLSMGQQLALVLSLQLVGAPAALLLDEPTRGLDYEAKRQLTQILRDQAAAGRVVLVATHDVELVAQVCDQVVVMAEGEVVASGPTRQLLPGSPLLATQVAKVYAPVPLLTVDEVVVAREAL